MAVQARRIVPALLVLLVLFVSQAAYAFGAFERPAFERPNGHCAGNAPPEQPCRLPLWLTCCDDHAAVPVGVSPTRASAVLMLPLETALVPALGAAGAATAKRAAISPDTPSRLSAVLRL